MEEKIKTFTLRLTHEQHELLSVGAEKEGLSKNQYITRLIKQHDNNQEMILKELLEIKELIKHQKDNFLD